MKSTVFEQDMSELEKGWEWINREFPFPGYIRPARKVSYFEMPKAISKWLPKGSLLLDFGAGPCDKTALLSRIGYNVTAFDDMGDDWYNFGDNRSKILHYATCAGIKYVLPDDRASFSFPSEHYDAIILNNVIEHLHDSPKKLLNTLLENLKTGGLIFIDVPNAANLRKRLDIVRGKTNYPSFESFYWSSSPWRGHVREFVQDDLEKLGLFLGLEVLEITSHHYHLERVGPFMRSIFKAVCRIFPSFRESWMFVGRKPAGWKTRNEPSEKEAHDAFKRQYYKYDKSDIEWEK